MRQQSQEQSGIYNTCIPAPVYQFIGERKYKEAHSHSSFIQVLTSYVICCILLHNYAQILLTLSKYHECSMKQRNKSTKLPKCCEKYVFT